MPAIQKNCSLKTFNTFGVDVLADQLFILENTSDLEQIKKLPKPHLVLGGGSNILFTQDFKGSILLNRLKGVKILSDSIDAITIEVAAGENWHEWVTLAVKNGWYGIEQLALIPGTVGAAPIQNIGAYGVEAASVIQEVHIYHPFENRRKIVANSECQFGYRDSIFKRELRDWIITSVIFKLHKKVIINKLYSVLSSWFEEKAITVITPELIFNAVIAIRQAKLPDIHKIGSAGSFFKNPIISITHFESLKTKHPMLVAYPAPNHQMKLAAGQLIDLLGFKGVYQENIGMYEHQALVLVNLGGATGKALFDYAKMIQHEVDREFNIKLEPEPLII